MEALKVLAGDGVLNEPQAHEIFESIMGNGEISDAQIGAYLYSTATRPLTADELVGGARSLRTHVTPVTVQDSLTGVELIDTCGTGGTGLDTFNTSTASSFVVAASGQPVAKHGNRGVTSRCGSADVLAALGIALDIPPQAVGECIAETNFGFMFAPQHHPATKRVVGIRKELGVRTIFNYLGPLSNPAGASMQVLGVNELALVPIMAEALQRLGVKRAMVVAGEEGLDELSVTASSRVAEVSLAGIKEYTITPEEFLLPRSSLDDIRGDEPAPAAQALRDVLNGAQNAKRHLVKQ